MHLGRRIRWSCKASPLAPVNCLSPSAGASADRQGAGAGSGSGGGCDGRRLNALCKNDRICWVFCVLKDTKKLINDDVETCFLECSCWCQWLVSVGGGLGEGQVGVMSWLWNVRGGTAGVLWSGHCSFVQQTRRSSSTPLWGVGGEGCIADGRLALLHFCIPFFLPPFAPNMLHDCKRERRSWERQHCLHRLFFWLPEKHKPTKPCGGGSSSSSSCCKRTSCPAFLPSAPTRLPAWQSAARRVTVGLWDFFSGCGCKQEFPNWSAEGSSPHRRWSSALQPPGRQREKYS